MGERTEASNGGPAGGESGGTGSAKPTQPAASAPAPATKAEVEAAENELLGRVVDTPADGGLSPLEPKPDVRVDSGEDLPDAPDAVQDLVEFAIAPSMFSGAISGRIPIPEPASATTAAGRDPADAASAATPTPHDEHPPIGEDVRAFAQLVDLTSGVERVPEPGESLPPMGHTLRGVLALGAIVGGAVALALLFMVLTGRMPGGSAPTGGTGAPQQGAVDAGSGPADGGQPAGGGAGDAQGGDAAASPADGSGGGAVPSADAAAAGGAVLPTSCFVPSPGTLWLEVTDVSWTDEDGATGSWDVVIHNRGDETFGVFMHEAGDANAATRANKWQPPSNDWDRESFYLVDPDSKADVATSRAGMASRSVEEGLPTLCSWERTDRVVAVYYRPECTEALWKQLNATPDAAAREALMAPYAVEMPVPDRMTTFSCAE